MEVSNRSPTFTIESEHIPRQEFPMKKSFKYFLSSAEEPNMALTSNPITFSWNHRSPANVALKLRNLIMSEKKYVGKKLIQVSYRYFDPDVDQVQVRSKILLYYKPDKDRNLKWVKRTTPASVTETVTPTSVEETGTVTSVEETGTVTSVEETGTRKLVDETGTQAMRDISPDTMEDIADKTTGTFPESTVSATKDDTTTPDISAHDDYDDYPTDIPISSANLNNHSLSLMMFSVLLASFALF